MIERKKKCLLLNLSVLAIILVIVDQVIKIWVKTNMSIGQHFDIFGDWAKIYFVENKGMAFGLSYGGDIGKIFLTSFRIIFFFFLLYWIYKLIKKGIKNDLGEYVMTPVPMLIALTMITAGAFGNIIDCVIYGQIFSESTSYSVSSFGGSYAPIFLGKVVDMFYFPMIDWQLPDYLPLIGGERFTFFDPVFNFADSCVSVGAAILILVYPRYFFK